MIIIKLLVIGCDGQLGKEITKILSQKNTYEFIGTNKKDLDICNFKEVDDFILKHKFDVVINCAAYTKVDLCESNKEKAFLVNSFAAKNIALSCEKIGAKLVYISTDYVFNGKKEGSYYESDKINPLSIYGKSKALGEIYTKMFSSKYFIIRTAWLYGDGNNFVKTMLNLSKTKDSISVVNDQFGSPTSTKDLANCILNLITTENYGIYHGTCNGYCSWYDFACKIFEFKNINIKVNPITSNEYKCDAIRPLNSVLYNQMLKFNNMDNFRDWQDALEEYLQSI